MAQEATSKFYPKLAFDESKLPSELHVIGVSALVLVLRSGFDLASNLTRRHEVAIEVTHQALYHLVTDKRWQPGKGELRAHFLELVRGSYTELRYGSRDERKASAAFAHEQGRYSTRSPEQILIDREEQGELDIRDAGRTAIANAIRERLSSHQVASGIIAIWEADGDVPPRKLAQRLGVSIRATYSAIELIRYHANEARNALRRKGAAS